MSSIYITKSTTPQKNVYNAIMYPVVDIECTERKVSQKADVLEYKCDRLRVVVQGTEIAINMRFRDGVYVGRQAGLEFVCTETYDDIAAQMDIR